MRVLVILAFGALIACACAELGLSPKDAFTISSCQDVGRACKADGGDDCYGKYDECMKDGGMR